MPKVNLCTQFLKMNAKKRFPAPDQQRNLRGKFEKLRDENTMKSDTLSKKIMYLLLYLINSL